MKIILTYPAWYILLCLLIGAAYSGLLYFREKQLPDASVWLKRAIASARFLVVALIAFLLLQPLVKSENRRVEKPVIAIAQDNSESLLIAPDSSFYKTEYLTRLNELKEKLSEKYEVKTYTIGASVREGLQVDFKDQTTDLGALFGELFTRYYNRNLGAVILASDGIFNRGASPLYGAKRLKDVPVFSIAMGDTTVRKDLIIADVAYNRLAYLGNDFPVNVMLDARKCAGHTVDVRIMKGNDLLTSKKTIISSENFSIEIPFTLEARQSGIQRYRIECTVLDDELSTVNNVRDIYIEVLNSKQKILLLANSPHPDIHAITSAVSDHKNYEVSTALFSDFKEQVNAYSLIILHQLPSLTHNAKNITDQASAAGVPVLYILGTQSGIPAFNALSTGLSIQNFRNGNTSTQASFNPGFSLFSMDEKSGRQFQKFPPLQIPFGDWKISQAVNSLFFQKIGSVETQMPLIMFNKESRQKNGIIAGEGIWRWKMQDFAQNGNNDLFNQLFQKSVQYLASRENKSFFRVFSQHEFNESDEIVLTAELYNQSYELVNEPEVELLLTNEENKEFRYIFSRNNSSYRLNAGRLEPGTYTYVARTTFNTTAYEAKGQFTVSPVVIELTQSVANFQLLQSLAYQTKGEVVGPRDLDRLAEMIFNKEEIVEVVYPERRFNDLLNFKWIFFLFLFLLSFEWFIRKWSGAY